MPRTGYGRISYQGRHWTTHRLAWTFRNGPIPDGMVICHSCDNTSCGNPDHLFVGTQADNLRDMWEKGRGHDGSKTKRGEEQYLSKLTEERVREARRLSAEGASLSELGAMYGVHPTTVGLAIRRRTWRHVS